MSTVIQTRTPYFGRNKLLVCYNSLVLIKFPKNLISKTSHTVFQELIFRVGSPTLISTVVVLKEQITQYPRCEFFTISPGLNVSNYPNNSSADSVFLLSFFGDAIFSRTKNLWPPPMLSKEVPLSVFLISLRHSRHFSTLHPVFVSVILYPIRCAFILAKQLSLETIFHASIVQSNSMFSD